MSPEHRELIDAGYLPIFEAAQSLVADTRLMFNTNDIIITAFVEKPTAQARMRTKLYGKTRKRTLELIEDVLPEAHKALSRLGEGPVPPSMFLILVIATPAIYVIDWPIAGNETQGVIN